MQTEAQAHVESYNRCLKFKSRLHSSEMHPNCTMYPSQLIHLDYLSIEFRKGEKDVSILTIMHQLTRYVQAIITASHTSKATAQALWDKLIVTIWVVREYPI